jgi:hypothetical protein
MDAFTLISSTSNVSSDEEADYEEFLTSAVPHPLSAVLRLLNEHLGDQIDFSVVQPRIGVKGTIAGEGLSHIVKNASKYIKI